MGLSTRCRHFGRSEKSDIEATSLMFIRFLPPVEMTVPMLLIG